MTKFVSGWDEPAISLRPTEVSHAQELTALSSWTWSPHNRAVACLAILTVIGLDKGLPRRVHTYLNSSYVLNLQVPIFEYERNKGRDSVVHHKTSIPLAVQCHTRYMLIVCP